MSRLVSSTRARVLTVAVSSAAVALLGLGSVPAAQAAPKAQISGTVTDAEGAGITGIVVTALEYDGDGGWAVVADTTTKKNGTYTIKNLPPATYTVEFRDDDGTYVDEYYDDQRDIEDANDVPVAAGQSVSNIDAELEQTGFVSGTVTDEQGEPISNIFIDFYSLDEDGFPSGEGFGGTTNDLGRYHVPFVAPGEYIIGFTDLSGTYVNEYYDDQLSIFDGELVAVTAGADTTGIDAELALGGHLSGTVTDSEGNGLGGIEIQLGILLDGEWDSFGEEFTYVTNEDGTYQIDGLPTGTYRVEFIDPERTYLSEQYDDKGPQDEGTPITVTAPATTGGINASLAKAAQVTGTVTDESGQPIEGIFVALRGLEDGNWSYFGDAETAADGTYSMDGLRPGTNYRVSFESQGDWAPEYWDDFATIDDATTVALTNGQTLSGVDAELAPAAHITGTAADPDGNPYDLTAVVAWRWTGSQWEEFAFEFAGDDVGPTHYDVGGLVPGTYRLEFDALDSFETPTGGGLTEVAHEFWNDQPSLELAQDVVVTSAGQVLEGYDAVLVRDQYPNEVENVTAPAITGNPVVGQALAASPGTWNLAATTFRYQWFAGSTPVGTNAPTYAPTAADVGKAITVTVLGSVAGIGSAAATSAPTAAVTGPPAPPTPPTPPPPTPTQKKVVNVEKPVIKGTIEVGHRARVTAGRWTPAAVTLSYKWFVDGERIANAVKRTLLLKEKWVGQRLTVKVTAKADGYLKAAVVTKRSVKIASG